MKNPRSSQKIFSLILLFTILTFACTIGENANPSPDTGVPFETAVALTVSANQTVRAEDNNGGSDEEQPADTDVPKAADTATPAPVDETVAPTDSPTETPTSSPTPTQVPTSTTVAGDPKIALGNSDWKDSFNSTTSWYLYDVANYKADISGGFYKYLIREKNYYSVWTISWPELRNYYVEVTTFTPDSCSGKDRYGLIFGAPLVKTDDGYLFEVSCDGSIRLGSFDGSENDYINLLPWQKKNAITTGGNQTHRLGVMRDGNNIKLYVNGILVGEVNDNRFTGKGRFGFLIGSENTDDFLIKFDDVQYWVLP